MEGWPNGIMGFRTTKQYELAIQEISERIKNLEYN